MIMLTMHTIRFLTIALVSFLSATALGDWSSPVVTGLTYQYDSYSVYWENEIARPKYECIRYLIPENGVFYGYYEFQVWSDWTDCEAVSINYSFSPLQWRESIEWEGEGDPPARDFTAAMAGFVTVGGAGYYDSINLLDGYGEGEGRSAIGAQVLGQNTGNTQGDQSAQQAIAGVKIEESTGWLRFAKLTKLDLSASLWPPNVSITASYLPQTYTQNPDTETKWFDDAIATWSGFYKRWTLNWIFAGFKTTCKAKGTTVIGGTNRPSTGFASITFNFRI